MGGYSMLTLKENGMVVVDDVVEVNGESMIGQSVNLGGVLREIKDLVGIEKFNEVLKETLGEEAKLYPGENTYEIGLGNSKGWAKLDMQLLLVNEFVTRMGTVGGMRRTIDGKSHVGCYTYLTCR